MDAPNWDDLDRDHLAEVARSGSNCVFASVSGAHLYGFPSPDSDVDLRGVFLSPASAMLGLHPPDETITITDSDTARIELDWVAHDLRKFARMMTRHDGYVLEQLYSPLVVITGPIHDALRDLGRGCVTRQTVRHYLGFFDGQRKRLREPNSTVKHLLYAYRVLLTGIHLMQTGAVISHLPTLNGYFELSEIDVLISRKREGKEKGLLDEAELPEHERSLEELEERLKKAHEKSALPEEPSTVAALDELVVRTRLEAI
jgi:predicted nucleotidyltransferase